jgi:hypothetical protein
VAEPDSDRGHIDGSAPDEVAFVVSGGDGAVLAELAEGTLHNIALPVGRRVEGGREAAATPEHAARVRGYKHVRLDTGRGPGNAPAAFPSLRHRVMSDGEQWADVDRGSGYKSEHDRIESEMRRSYSPGEMAPELAVLRRPATCASQSIGNA